MLANFISPSNNPYLFSDITGQEKDGTWRFCVDYRLNFLMEKYKFSISIIDDLLDDSCGAMVFSKND